mgnify:CR=1 FL=1
MTTAIPKDLLSPTHHNKKHKHAKYFESAVNVENQFENTAPIIFNSN